jgi:ABC-type antimicrobial peptide transport system permease subunit
VTSTVSRPAARDSWLRDFALGLRLAVGGGRTSWARLALGTVGIGLAATVLLLFASVGTITTGMNGRLAARAANSTVVSGVSPTQVLPSSTSFKTLSIDGSYLHGTGPRSPVPPGLAALPGPSEIVLSPALSQLIAENPELRQRFPQRVVGVIGDAGLRGPADLLFYAGTGPLPVAGGPGLSTVVTAYSFGRPWASGLGDPTLLIVTVISSVALLIPIFIFVSVSSRIAGAQRDRRLAALRLVGAGDRQVRRIAAAESLVAAAFGLLLGTMAFLGLRQLAPRFELLGWSFFTSDVVPSVPLTVLVVLLVPVLTVGTVLFAMRRVIIEPLGVVRGGKPVRRRAWWRLALIVGGIALLLAARSIPADGWLIAEVTIGASALLIGVPAILPWLLERSVDRIHGGAPSWQLAIRRLQLDSGTPARVVSGVAVVLASAIAMQLMLLSTAIQYTAPDSSDNWVPVYSTAASASRVSDALGAVPAAKHVYPVASIDAFAGSLTYDVTVAPCATITLVLHVDHCVDGQGFLAGSAGQPAPRPGDTWRLAAAGYGVGASQTLGSFTVPTLPTVTQPVARGSGPYIVDGVVLTPALAVGLPLERHTETWVDTDPAVPNATDQIATAVAPLTWQVFVSYSTSDLINAGQSTFVTVRAALLTGSVFTLFLAGISMLVLTLEQVRERRRPLAMLAAAGVPRSVLARSLLWQTAVPVVLGVVVAVGVGIAIAGLVIRLTGQALRIDWPTIGTFAGVAVALVLLVTACSLPSLRAATRLAALRTE